MPRRLVIAVTAVALMVAMAPLSAAVADPGGSTAQPGSAPAGPMHLAPAQWVVTPQMNKPPPPGGDVTWEQCLDLELSGGEHVVELNHPYSPYAGDYWLNCSGVQHINIRHGPFTSQTIPYIRKVLENTALSSEGDQPYYRIFTWTYSPRLPLTYMWAKVIINTDNHTVLDVYTGGPLAGNENNDWTDCVHPPF